MKIRKSLVLWACLAVAIGTMSAAAPALAGKLAAFNLAVADAYRHFRGAAFYLRTGNAMVASFELEDMAKKWRALESRFRDAPPDAFADDPAWRRTLGEIGARANKALAAAEDGDTKAAATVLLPVRRILARLRARNGVRVFSDCINKANRVGDAIWAFRANPPDFDDRARVDQLRDLSAVVSYVFKRCGEEAPVEIRDDEAFRRPIRGAQEEMARVRLAIRTLDARLLSVALGQFRSFDRILFLKFG